MMRAELVEAEHRALRQAQATFPSGLSHWHPTRTGRLPGAVAPYPHCYRAQRVLGGLRGPQLPYCISFYQILGYSLLFIGCVLALRALVLVFRRSWSP